MLYKKYGYEKTKWLVLRNCYDDQTEILTEHRGWVLFKNLVESDRVAMLDGDKTVFVNPTCYYQADYVGEMIGFENEGLDFLVTPDHKLSVSLRNARKHEWSEYRLRKARDCYGKTNMRVRRSATWDGIHPGMTPDIFEWLGYWFAEGSTTVKEYNGSTRHNCIITTKNDLQYAKRLFEQAGLPYTVNNRSDGSYNIRLSVNFETKPLIIKLSRCGKAISKSIPSEWKNAPTEHLQRFIKGYLAGDGSHRKNDNTVCASTSSASLADDLQEIGLRAGYVVNINTVSNLRQLMVINGVETRQNAQSITVTFLTPSKYNPYLKASGRYRGWYRKNYSGKVYCIEVPTHLVYVRRNGRAFWCSQTYRELIDTTQRTMFDWFDPAWFGKYQKSENVYTITKYDMPIEAEIIFRSCDSPDDIKKFKSLELTGYWIDESIEVHGDVKRMVKSRLGRFPVKSELRFGIETTNPPDVEDDTYSQFAWQTHVPGPVPERRPLENHHGWWQPPNENNANLRQGYYTDLILDYADNPDWIARYVRGEPGITLQGKPVYNNFRRELHVAKEPLQGDFKRLYCGWDNTGNCPACVVAAIPTAGRIFILREYHSERSGIVDFTNNVLADRNARWPDVEWHEWGDPAGEARFSKHGGGLTSNAELMRESGIMLRPSEQNWMARKESVEFQLGRLVAGEPAMTIDPSCIRLINGFIGGYAYKEQSSGIFANEPMKNKYSHCLVGETRVETATCGVMIKDLAVGDFVKTPIGYKKIIAKMSSFADEMYCVELSNGNAIYATADHPVYTTNGIVRADSLRYNDVVLNIKPQRGSTWAGKENIKSKSSTALGIIKNRAAIINQTLRNTAESIFTGLFGNTTTGQLQKAYVFTTSTGIKATINCKTFWQLIQAHTQNTTPLKTLEKFQSAHCEGLKPHKKQQELGMEVKRGWLGIPNTEKNLGITGKLKSIFARFAERITRLSKELSSAGSVHQIVKARQDACLGLITNKGLAEFAEESLQLTDTRKSEHAGIRVVNLSRLDERERVYDITVEDAHCFYANGVLVGNCHDALQYVMVMLLRNVKAEARRPRGRGDVTGFANLKSRYAPRYNGEYQEFYG